MLSTHKLVCACVQQLLNSVERDKPGVPKVNYRLLRDERMVAGLQNHGLIALGLPGSNIDADRRPVLSSVGVRTIQRCSIAFAVLGRMKVSPGLSIVVRPTSGDRLVILGVGTRERNRVTLSILSKRFIYKMF